MPEQSLAEAKAYRRSWEAQAYKKGWNDALKVAREIILSIDNKKGNEKEIVKAISERKVTI